MPRTTPTHRRPSGDDNHRLHDREAFNLNPASNVMNPLCRGLDGQRPGSRASLGYPGDKHETGLDAVEQFEVMAAELAAQVFAASHVELRAAPARWPTFMFMATARPGDTIIAPPPAIGGHVTHHRRRCGGSAW